MRGVNLRVNRYKSIVVRVWGVSVNLNLQSNLKMLIATRVFEKCSIRGKPCVEGISGMYSFWKCSWKFLEFLKSCYGAKNAQNTLYDCVIRCFGACLNTHPTHSFTNSLIIKKERGINVYLRESCNKKKS